jgi:hypothetical protein
LTAAGRTATFTLVEFPEDRHFVDVAMKKGKWFVFNERRFFFVRQPGWWNQRNARKYVSSILRRAERTSLMVTANRKLFKDRLRVRSAWRMEFPADALGASKNNCNITLIHEDAVPYLLAQRCDVQSHSKDLYDDCSGVALIYHLCKS